MKISNNIVVLSLIHEFRVYKSSKIVSSYGFLLLVKPYSRPRLCIARIKFNSLKRVSEDQLY